MKTKFGCVLVIATVFCVFSASMAEASHSFFGQRDPMSQNDTKDYDGFIYNKESDENAAVTLTAKIGRYTERWEDKDGNNHLALTFSSTVNTRMGMEYFSQIRDPYVWADYDDATDTGIQGDDEGKWFTIPQFTVNYWGAIYDKVYICANGYIILGSFTWTQDQLDSVGSCIPSPSGPLPDTSAPNGVIAPYWTDLNPNAGGEITIKVDTSDMVIYYPGAKFVITWSNVPDGNGVPRSFQIVITSPFPYPEDWHPFNPIYFSYKNIYGEPDAVGIENQLGSRGVDIGPSVAKETHYFQTYSRWEATFVKSLEVKIEKNADCSAVDIDEPLVYGYNLELENTENVDDAYLGFTMESVALILDVLVPEVGIFVSSLMLVASMGEVLSDQYSEADELGTHYSDFGSMEDAWVKGNGWDEVYGRKAYDSSLAFTADWLLRDGCTNPELTARAILTYETREEDGQGNPVYTDTALETEVLIMLDDDNPLPVTQGSPTDIRAYSVRLHWIKTNEDDPYFGGYELHFKAGTDDDFTPIFPPLGGTYYSTVVDRNVEAETIHGLMSQTNYCFKVIVRDMSNRHSNPNTGRCITTAKGGGGPPGGDPPPGGSGPGASPYVFPWNGEDFEQDNSLLPKSEDLYRPEVKTPDYYVLRKDLVENGPTYDLKIMEFEGEVSNLDEISLRTIDHDSGYNISVDSVGNVLTWSDPVLPEASIDWRGDDILGLVNEPDGDSYYEGWDGYYITVDFDKTEIGENGNLIVRSDVKYDSDWQPIGEFPPYLPSELGPIEIRMLDGNMDWIPIGSLFPRTFWSYDVYDLSQHIWDSHPDVLRIRFDWKAHHKIDFVGIENPQWFPYSSTTLYPISAEHSRFGDVLVNLSAEDEVYVLLENNDTIDISFSYSPPGFAVRDFVLCTKGYYFFGVDDIDISAPVEVSMDMIGGDSDSRVGLFLLENSTYFTYNYATLNQTFVDLGGPSPPPLPVKEYIYGFGDREYNVMLWYQTNGTETTYVQIEVESENSYESHNFTFDPNEGFSQTVIINITQVVYETVSNPGNASASSSINAELEFTPKMVPLKNQTFTWESIYWDFGDGHQETAYESERIKHEYENPGIYLLTMIVTYQDTNTITKTKTIEIAE